MADPFDFSTQDPNSPGLFGLPVSTWQDLARFGANLASGANARTATGHLANGTGFAGPFGSAVTATMDSGRQNAIARSGLAHQAAETQGLNLQNQINALGLPFQRALSQARERALANMQGGGPAVGGASGVEPSGVGPPGLGAAEGGNNPAAVNGQGFSGQYQFGAPRLAELGLYQPAQGEPLNSNKWTGQFNIPGFPDVKTQADFLGNQQAQNAAYQAHMQNIDQAIQSTPGAANLDQNGLRAVAHLGGVHGMQQFIATGGQYNPHDANGTYLSDYYQKFSGHGAASPASGPRRTQVPGAYQVASNAPVPPPSGFAPLTPNPAAPSVQPTERSTPGHSFTGPGQTPPPYRPAGAPPPYQSAQADGTAPPMPSQAPQPGTPDARAMAQRLRAEATSITQQANNAALLGNGLAGDPQILRQSAMEKIKLADALDTAGPMEAAKARAKGDVDLTMAGPIAGAKAAAEFPYKTERVNPGGVLAVGGKPAFSVPQRSEEVLTTGPNVGTKGQVYRDPMTGSQVTPPQGEAGQPGMPPGFMPTHLSPQQHGTLANIPTIQKNFVEHDNKIVDEDLSHVIENVIPAKQQLFQLRALNPDANTGAAGEFRMNFKNWVQTFAPEFVSQVAGDASPAQEFKKIALMGAGKQERGDLGARGGFRAIELYLHANPSLENQPTANRDMANALLVSHQMHEDYATGATDFFNKQVQSIQNAQEPKPYTKLSVYDQQFIQKMRPELYAAAIGAVNGKPYAEWSKGLTGPQMQIVGGILQRADPNAQINIQDRMVPVNAFTTTISPMDIMGGSGGR